MDDNKVIRQLIRVNLELEGLEVVTAADGVECLDVVHQFRPDVITLDVVMPRLDGLRTAARLRSDPRTRHLPLAIVSACSQYEVETGLDVGVDAFLAKPFEPAELVALVRELIQRCRAAGTSACGDASVGDGGASLDLDERGASGASGVEGSLSGERGAFGVTASTSSSSSTSTSLGGVGGSESAEPAGRNGG
ncbi:response regulator [Streptomyces poonensis]|uniref:Response regulator n=1 Tax=Streptomyces poonensis TaxID=68255 RepID=A0A918UCK8_9ACTN|nr:response regulator [Streptomyces poonensis]